jgi:hypothetical protein
MYPIALADVNGDGIPDMIGLGLNGTGGAVRLGLGDGRFQPAIYSADFSANAVIDFNADGKADAVGWQHFFLSNGNGTFQTQTLWTNTPVLTANAADFNGDGKPDILAQISTNLLFFAGNGNGTFAQPVAIPSAPTDFSRIVTGDFNGDRIPDVFNIVRDGATLYLSEGGVPLHKSVIWSGSTPQTYFNYTAGDINGDGKDDLVSFVGGFPSSFLQVDLSNGDGTFSPAPNQTLADSNTAANIVLADFNGDGKLDVALYTVPSAPTNVVLNVLLGNGNGTFQEPAKFTTFLHYDASISMASADLNGDGTPDLVLGDLIEGFDVWLNDCTPNTPPTIYQQPLSQIVEEGRDVTFSVGANGVLAQSYQWLFNGTNIAGATGRVLTIHQVHPSDSGNYSVVVHSGATSTTSVIATLKVTPNSSSGTWTNLDQVALQEALNGGSDLRFGIDGVVQLTSPLIVTANSTLDANGHAVILDGNNLASHFQVNAGATLRLVNLLLRNGQAHGRDGDITGPGLGGSIASFGGNLELIGCTFTNNRATGGNGAPALSGTVGGHAFGGAVYALDGAVAATNCTFLNNGSTGGQGGDATFTFFTVPGGDSYGGALFTSNCLVHLDGVQFLSNLAQAGKPSSGKPRNSGAQSFGGAYAAIGGTIDLRRCVCTVNRAIGQPNYEAGATERGSGSGGALFHNEGSLAVAQTLFASNSVTGGGGFTSDLQGNLGANGNGGALCNWAGSVEVRESALVFNRAVAGTPIDSFNQFGLGGTGSGGAVYNRGVVLLSNCTLAENIADGGLTNISKFGKGGAARGGSLFSEGGSLSLQNVTVAQSLVKPGNNSGLAFGASLYASNSIVVLTNSILACANSQTNVSGTILDGGHNLCSDASAAFTSATSRNSVDPMLGPLGDNGGPTPTLALLLGSPAIDSGDPAGCALTDQRGIPRPLGLGCDIGAFEFSPKLLLNFTPELTTLEYIFLPGRTYGIQSSTNLHDWTSIGRTNADLNGHFEFKSGSLSPMQFFRVIP